MPNTHEQAKAYWKQEVEYQLGFVGTAGIPSGDELASIVDEVAEEVISSDGLWCRINEAICDMLEDRISKTVLEERVRKHLKDELEDDDSETGGTAYAGETLFDFISYYDEHEGLITAERVNADLRKNGIKPIDFGE